MLTLNKQCLADIKQIDWEDTKGMQYVMQVGKCRRYKPTKVWSAIDVPAIAKS